VTSSHMDLDRLKRKTSQIKISSKRTLSNKMLIEEKKKVECEMLIRRLWIVNLLVTVRFDDEDMVT
jgi:hypothetical protein